MPTPTPLALAIAMLWLPLAAQAQLAPGPRKDNERNAPIVLQADEVRGRPDLEAVAEGNVQLQRGSLTIRTDRLVYETAEDLARARGNVRITTGAGDRFSGPELELRLDRFEGFFIRPEYYFARTQAGGRAERIDFQGAQRSLLSHATYTSCALDGTGAPAWLLSTDRVKLDFESNVGVAEGAVLRFYGVPILAAPTLSFPISDARKSGWLPPAINLDSKSGLEVSAPYYWNIAPQRDATIAPTIYTRRGLAADSEFRYLEPAYQGEVALHLLPHDRASGSNRWALQGHHDGVAFGNTTGRGVRYRIEGLRASDDNYWKDFPRTLHSLTPRLLNLVAQAERDLPLASAQTTFYARVQRWQVLQDADPQARIVAPYNRSPQLGWRGAGRLAGAIDFDFETELNQFTRPDDGGASALPRGLRWHGVASVSRSWRTPGAWLTPRLAANLASYRMDEAMSDGRRSASRAIPTFSLDGGLLFERDALWFGRPLRQTLEPRVLYVNTPFRAQATLPQFDSAAKDFNTVSVFSDNPFTGIDRVADAHQVTAGVISRLLDPETGAEALRLGLAQRYLLRDQQITPDGVPLAQRFSDVLLVGAASLVQRWTLDGALQYSPETNRITRSVLSVRYSPGPFRTVGASYRLARGASEQLDLGWQWPLLGAVRGAAAAGSASGCGGTLYSVGRVNYSLRDKRITDSLAGFEYDNGCWIARLVGERVSTGRSAATTRLLFQLELVGLSRLGSNPLQVLKDNIPGYRLLRDERNDPPLRTSYE